MHFGRAEALRYFCLHIDSEIIFQPVATKFFKGINKIREIIHCPDVDRFMALRVLHYICKFYLDLLELHKYKILPPVFPVVLYNGNERWSAPVEIEDLIENVKGLEGYVPKFKYCKIAENEYSKQELEKVKNLIAALFYIENSSAEEIQKALGQIVNIIASEQDKSAVKRFIT